MTKISNIADDNIIDKNDRLLGSDGAGTTFNYKIEDLLAFFKNQNQMTDAEIVDAINSELGGTTWQASGGAGGSMTGTDIVNAINFELGNPDWQTDTQLTDAEVVSAINTVLGNINWQTDTNTQLSNAEVVTAINTELGNTNWQTDTDTNTQLTDAEVVTAVNNQIGNTDWQTDTDTQLTPAEVIASIDGSIGTGWKREDFATTAQGAKADSAVQTSGGNYSFANVISSTLVTLTISAGSVNWNADGRNLHKIVLTTNCTLENGSNPISGTQYQFIVEQDATGNHTLAYGSLFKFPGGTAPTIPVAANSKSIITCLFDGTHYLAVSAENFS